MEDIKEYLKKHKIEYKVFNHPHVYTVEEASKYNKEIRGIHCKNLFIKEKKSRNYYLVILPAEEKLDLGKFEALFNQKLKFANEDDLKDILGLTTGAVSPFGLINDQEYKTELIINKKVWESDFVSFHPNINTETLELSKDNFHKYVNSLKNKLVIV
ncbi:aminoacyl-tRNA deacylase [Candidatus Pacearchaeota archaeon]|nr:aminoacyl-tRNA deacylase [Candidatus Pacearchaeota archaeon]